jgi:hypothetical protein
MGKKFNQFLRRAAASGTYVGDLNQASQAFLTGEYPTEPSKSDAPAPPPPIKFDTSPRKLDDGENLKVKKKSKRSRKAISKGTGQLRIGDRTGVASSGGAQAGGTGGLNLSK